MYAGIILILFGLVWLLSDLGLLGLDASRLWLLWPLVLVVLGLELLLGNRPRDRRAAVLLTLALLALSLFWLLPVGNGSTRTEKLDIGLESGVERVALTISPIVADFSLASGAAGDRLLTGEVELLPGEKLRTSSRRRGAQLTASIQVRAGHLHWKGPGPRWRIYLNPRPSYSLNLKLDVGGGRVDLRGLKVETCSLKFRVGKATVYLPDHPGECEIFGGVGELTVYLPKTTAVALEVSKGIGALEVSGLEGGNGAWSRGQGEPLRLKLSAGVGRIRVLTSP
ncbi:LiaF transmembrane domain-containing protein [Oceanithermus sp.]